MLPYLPVGLRAHRCAALTRPRPPLPSLALQYESKKLGKKGRFVVDDPSKYPGRTEYTGGWAGGEAGLKAFVAAYQREKELNGAPPAKAAKADRAPQPIAKGSDTIYLGKGRVIQDDARK